MDGPWWVKHWRQDGDYSDEIGSATFSIVQSRTAEVVSCTDCGGTGFSIGKEPESERMFKFNETNCKYEKSDNTVRGTAMLSKAHTEEHSSWRSTFKCWTCKGQGRVVEFSYKAKIADCNESSVRMSIDEAEATGKFSIDEPFLYESNQAIFSHDISDWKLEQKYPELSEKNRYAYLKLRDALYIEEKLTDD